MTGSQEINLTFEQSTLLCKYADESRKLISARKWQKLKEFITKTSLLSMGPSTTKSYSIFSPTFDINPCALHFACQKQAPYDVIKKLMIAYPKAVRQQDFKGRYPLHIACKHGCNPGTIVRLLQKYPEAAKQTDIKQRTPFLLACKSYVSKSACKPGLANSYLVEVLLALKRSEPTSPSKNDYKGLTGLEYTIDRRLSDDVVKCVQRLQDIKDLDIAELKRKKYYGLTLSERINACNNSLKKKRQILPQAWGALDEGRSIC